MFEQRLARSPRQAPAETIAARSQSRGSRPFARGGFSESKTAEGNGQAAALSSVSSSFRPAWDFTALPLLSPDGGSFSAAPPGAIQTKLEIGALDDPLEREADRVADKVMRMDGRSLSLAAAPLQISRKCASCAKEDEEKKSLWMKPAGAATPMGEAPPIVADALGESGQPLDAASRAFFEPRFARDFGAVRLHAGAKAAQSARAIGARAYTVGRDIVLAADAPASALAGRRLLAHELAHVVQQSAGERSLRRQDDDSGGASKLAAGGGCRKTTRVPCPGGKDKYATIERFSPMYLVNTGPCTLWIKGIDAQGKVMDPSSADFLLHPGETANYFPPAGSKSVAVNCQLDCEGVGSIEHPFSCV
jgi:hypothetical protein